MQKRYRIEGSIFYITSNVYHRVCIFTHPSFIIPIIASLNYYRYQYACKLIGYVIMPDHIHYMHLNPVRAGLCTSAADYPIRATETTALGITS